MENENELMKEYYGLCYALMTNECDVSSLTPEQIEMINIATVMQQNYAALYPHKH